MDSVDFNPSYIGQRPDIEKLVPNNVQTVLDVGCSVGSLGAAIKERTGATVIGIELSEQMAQVAKLRIDKVIVGDATSTVVDNALLEDYQFDVIVFADILEHLADPWLTLRAAAKHLCPTGIVIASIPNVRHVDTIWNLTVRGVWPHRDRGIHDRTHLRFFTRSTITEMFDRSDLRIESIHQNYRLIEDPSSRLNRFARWLAFPGIADFLVFQFLIVASRKTFLVTENS